MWWIAGYNRRPSVPPTQMCICVVRLMSEDDGSTYAILTPTSYYKPKLRIPYFKNEKIILIKYTAFLVQLNKVTTNPIFMVLPPCNGLSLMVVSNLLEANLQISATCAATYTCFGCLQLIHEQKAVGKEFRPSAYDTIPAGRGQLHLLSGLATGNPSSALGGTLDAILTCGVGLFRT